jgi:hypothetical protein
MTFIYTLSDKNGVRYIGKSNEPSLRLKVHLKESKYKRTRKEKWINSLLEKEEFPIMEIIDEVDDTDWEFFEIYWIAQFKAWGFDIINGTDGGEGSNGFKGKKHSEETKIELRKKSNVYYSEEKNKKDASARTKELFEKNPYYNSKKIFQYDLNGIFLKETTLNQANKELKIPKSNIIECGKGRRKTAGKFIWKYEKS